MSWSIDGIEWEWPCTIERVAEVTASDISGMMLDKTYFNDVIGTWLRYTIAIAIPKGEESFYSHVFEKLTSPVNYHIFVLPYNDTTVTLTAKVSIVSDAWVRLPNGKQTWRRIRFEIIGTAPTKEATMSGLKNHGLAPYPTAASPSIGDMYEWTELGWTYRDYEHADERRY